MLIEIKRNSHIKINEMLETKENILSLTYIMKMNSP
jgi:hypothetical protein